MLAVALSFSGAIYFYLMRDRVVYHKSYSQLQIIIFLHAAAAAIATGEIILEEFPEPE